MNTADFDFTVAHVLIVTEIYKTYVLTLQLVDDNHVFSKTLKES